MCLSPIRDAPEPAQSPEDTFGTESNHWKWHVARNFYAENCGYCRAAQAGPPQEQATK